MMVTLQIPLSAEVRTLLQNVKTTTGAHTRYVHMYTVTPQ